MKKPNSISNTTEALSENVHRHSKWLAKQRESAKKQLTPKMFEMFCKYDNELVMTSVSTATRHKNLIQFIKIVREYKIEDLESITEEQVKAIVVSIMTKHSNNGQESWYSFDIKKQLRYMIRFAKTGSRERPITGELPEIMCIRGRTVKDKLTREDLPTDEECRELLRACGDSLMDKAMFAVHMEAGTRIKELLSLQIKHVVVDEYGAIISVDGKTGARKIRIVSSVPDLVKWINGHPYREDRNHALFISTYNDKFKGCGLSYHNFQARLSKYCKQAGITKRMYSHLFRHKEITDLAGKLTEAQSRIRHGWSPSSPMPSRYTHMNNQDVDDKMLEIFGVKKQAVEEDPKYIECMFCHIKHPVDTRFCESCAKPLDVVEAERMQREQKEETQAMIYELVRKERAEKAKRNYHDKRGEVLQEQIQSQQEEIQSLKDMITKMSKAE